MSAENKAKILECVANKINTLRKISEHLDICKSSVDLILRKMRQDKIVESTTQGRINVFRLTEPKTYHDPFRLCITQSKNSATDKGTLRLDAKAGIPPRHRHSIDNEQRSESIIDAYCENFKAYGKPKELRDIL